MVPATRPLGAATAPHARRGRRRAARGAAARATLSAASESRPPAGSGSLAAVPDVPGFVADHFAETVGRPQERESLSSLAVSSYKTHSRGSTRGWCCGRRSSADHDRITSRSKSLRRLGAGPRSSSTPSANHIRTRMTHTLRRLQSRASSLERSVSTSIWPEPSASGTTCAVRRWGAPGERARPRPVGRYGRVPPRPAVASPGRLLSATSRPEPDPGSARGSSSTPGRRARGARGRDVGAPGRRVAYIWGAIEAVRARGVLRCRNNCAPVALLGDTAEQHVVRLVHDLVESSARPATSCGAKSARRFFAACLDLSAGLPGPRPKTVGGAGSRRGVFDPSRSRRLGAGIHGDEIERVTDYVAGMTDRFALAYAGSIQGR